MGPELRSRYVVIWADIMHYKKKLLIMRYRSTRACHFYSKYSWTKLCKHETENIQTFVRDLC